MTTNDLLHALRNAFETAADARQQIEDDDDDHAGLADLMRDIASDFEELGTATTFEDAGMLTRDAGLVVRTSGGAEFQITIVQTRQGDDDSDE